MSLWLDANRYAPSTFTYFFLLPGMKVRISFDDSDEASAFAEEFDGIVLDAADGPVPHAGAVRAQP